MAIGTFETAKLYFRINVLKEIFEFVLIHHFRDIISFFFCVNMIEIEGTEGFRRHLSLAYLTAPDSHLNGLHMAPLLCLRYFFRHAALYGGVNPMTEAAEGTDLSQFLLQGFHAAMPRPPWIVGASVYLLFQVIRFDAIGCPAMEACMRIAPLLPELLALAFFSRI